MHTRTVTHVGLFAALIAVCTLVAIPLPGGVPVTLQTFAVHLGGILLGAKKGTAAVLVYILIGMTGVPVFANFRGGWGVLAGPTGGFLFTFPVMAFLTGLAAQKKRPYIIVAMLAGTVVNFVGGAFFFMRVTGSTLQAAFMTAVFPFLGWTAFTLTVLTVAAPMVRVALTRQRLL